MTTKHLILILGLTVLVLLCAPVNAFGVSNSLYRGTIQNGSSAPYNMGLFLTWGEPTTTLAVTVDELTGYQMDGSAVSWITVDKTTVTLINPDNILFNQKWTKVIGTMVPEKAVIKVPQGTAPGLYRARIFYKVMGVNGMVQWGIQAPISVTVT